MALFQCNFFSKAINISTGFNVIFPEQPVMKKYPVLYLLHGYTDDYTIWQRRTSIERYAAQYEVAIVMPDVQKSFYSNFHGITSGYKYWTYVSEELPEVVSRFFNVSNKREDTFVAGLSMGGFGAFKLALNCPERYFAAASLSGAVDIPSIINSTLDIHIERKNEILMLLGDEARVLGSENDLQAQVLKLAGSEIRPKLYQCCGTEDFLYEDNVRFRDFILDKGFDYIYDEGPGVHTWDYWDMQIQKVLAWLPLATIQRVG